MTERVDFYVLKSADDRTRLVYACRLVEKAYLSDHTVYVHLGSAGEAEAFDTLLWTFADRSFVPHELAALEPRSPVVVGCGTPWPAQVLVNLAPDPPGFYADYVRVAEFVDADPARREAGRKRFAWYRDRGHRPTTHEVGSE